MVIKYGVGDIVLVPFEVLGVEVHQNGEIEYRLAREHNNVAHQDFVLEEEIYAKADDKEATS